MGNCDSSTEFSRHKNTAKFSSISSPSLPSVSIVKMKGNPPYHKSKKNLSLEPNKFLLPEKLAKREDIMNYYKLSQNIISYGATSLLYIGENIKKEKYAVKRVLKSNIAKKQKMVIKEAEICLKLKHKNIIRYYEIYEDNHFINIIMELADTDLFELIINSPNGIVPDYLAIDILIQIFEVIDFLHTKAYIVHSDLKPENFVIKLDKNSKKIILKLIDFGNARGIREGGANKIFNFCGTKEYMAPEAFELDGFNEKIDEWAAGVIMFNMLTGCDPFSGENDSDFKDNILYKEINFDIIKNEQLRNLNKKLLERYVAKRITAKEALDEIIKIKNDLMINDIKNNINKNEYEKFLEFFNNKITMMNLS